MKPVTLVSTVVVRKIAVQPSRRLPLSSANRTMNPVPSPARLMITCTRVKVDRDMPKTIVGVLSEWFVKRPRVQQYPYLEGPVSWRIQILQVLARRVRLVIAHASPFALPSPHRGFSQRQSGSRAHRLG